MFDTASVKEKTRLGLAPPLGGLTNGAFGNAAHFCGVTRSPLLHVFGHRIKAYRVRIDEAVIEPVVFDHQVQNAVEQSDIAPGLDRQKQVTRSCNWSDSRIDDDNLRAVLSGLPHIIGRNRSAFGNVSSADPNDFS